MILVEDELAKMVVSSSIEELNLRNSRLVSVIPVGGWQNVLKLQMELESNNVLGVGKTVFSILDGDVKNNITKEYKTIKKMFLPINSVEKYLFNVLVDSPNLTIKKSINDLFFPIESLDSVIKDYKNSEKKLKQERGDDYRLDNDGKRLYNVILKSLKKRKVTEEHFVQGIFTIVKKNVDLTDFNNSLLNMLE